MLPARRSALGASRAVQRQVKRGYSGQSGSHSDHQHTQDQPHHAEHANTTETFGPRFFFFLTALPLGWIAYDYSVSDPKNPPFVTKYILNYREVWDKEFERRNDLHTRAVQRAADDRLLFGSAEPTQQMIDLKFPEQFNSGSPFINVAGHRADLRELAAHYQKKNQETEEKIANKTQEQRDKYL